MKLLIVVLSALLVGCASVKTTLEDTDTYIVCKTADVATTYVGVSNGHFIEKNPVVAKLLTHGWLPWIVVSVGIYYILIELDNKEVTTVVNSVTCGAALNNTYLLVK